MSDPRKHGGSWRDGVPFVGLEVPSRRDGLTKPFVEKWVAPFYMLNLWNEPQVFLETIRPVYAEIDERLVAELLSYVNWRPRIVGGYFAGAKRLLTLQDQIGRLLLRSDLCDAGRGYCIALARMNTDASSQFLCEYLDYYLTRADLWFDQGCYGGAWPPGSQERDRSA